MSSAFEIVGSSSIGRTPSISAQSAAPREAAAPVRTSQTTSRTVNIVQDPSAGFITEFLSAHSGEIISQVPSAKTVAYLRQGLSPEGQRPEESITA